MVTSFKINIKGDDGKKTPKTIKIQHCILSVRDFCEDRGIGLAKFGEVLESNDVFAIMDLVYYGGCAYAEFNGTSFPYSKREVTQWLEREITQPKLTKITNDLMEMYLMDEQLSGMANAADDEQKKT